MHSILKSYESRKRVIKKRLRDFKKQRDLFPEMVFCLLTPQSKARRCWQAVKEMKENGLLFNGSEKKIAEFLQSRVRFHNSKARNIVKARDFFFNTIDMNNFNNVFELREYLVKNVCGFGYKEASHFLRNVGYKNIAILDRHILKNLVKDNVIKEIPKTLTPKRYLEIEKKMKKFSEKINIPMGELDLLFWSNETGEVFK